MVDPLTWLLAEDLGRDKVALLVLCMLATYVLSAQLDWRWRRSAAGPSNARPGVARHGAVSALGRSWFGRWASQTLRLFYYVGIPLVVLWRGALVREMGIPTTFVGLAPVESWDGMVVLSLLGMAETDDVLQFVRGLVVGGGSLCALVVLWVWYARTILRRVAPGRCEPLLPVPWWEALREALFLQLLWALYRGFATVLIPNRVYAAFASLALVSIPWLLDPRRWHTLFTLRGYLVVQDWLIALLTVFVSLTTPSLWFLILVHTLWRWVGGRVLAHLSVSHVQGAPAIGA
jgi:hypothetical protein